MGLPPRAFVPNRSFWETPLCIRRGCFYEKSLWGSLSTMKTVISGERELSLVKSLRHEFSIYRKVKDLALVPAGQV